MEWMLAHPWMVFWLAALAIICTAETVQVVAKERGLKSLHRTMQEIAEVEKMKMEGK